MNYCKYEREQTIKMHKGLISHVNERINTCNFYIVNKDYKNRHVPWEKLQAGFSLEMILCVETLEQVQRKLDFLKTQGFLNKKTEKKCEKLKEKFIKHCEERYNISRATLLGCVDGD